MSALRCFTRPLGTLAPYKYVVVCSRYQGQWLLSRHHARSTWETQGGHIEPGETPLQAAVRELYEESGVQDADVHPLCDYRGYDDSSYADGVVFLADVHALSPLPDSEMQEARLFPELPENLTYPLVTPVFMQEALQLAARLGIQ